LFLCSILEDDLYVSIIRIESSPQEFIGDSKMMEKQLTRGLETTTIDMREAIHRILAKLYLFWGQPGANDCTLELLA
jgi:hypothetical protein